MKIEMTSTVELDIPTLAKVFSALDDDEQARFFVEVAKHFTAFGDFGFDQQAYYIGSHLRNCKCSTDESRQLILLIASAIESGEHGKEAA